MALYPSIHYGDIDFDGLYKPRNLPKVQRITNRHEGYVYDSVRLGDYNVLDSIYDESFFNLPFIQRLVLADEFGRPDLIAYRVYSDTDFWGFILMYNRIADPFFGYTAGFNMKIPQYQPLVSWLTRNLVQYNINNR